MKIRSARRSKRGTKIGKLCSASSWSGRINVPSAADLPALPVDAPVEFSGAPFPSAGTPIMTRCDRKSPFGSSSRVTRHAFFHEGRLLFGEKLQCLLFAILKLIRRQLGSSHPGLLPYGIVVGVDAYFDLLSLAPSYRSIPAAVPANDPISRITATNLFLREAGGRGVDSRNHAGSLSNFTRSRGVGGSTWPYGWILLFLARIFRCAFRSRPGIGALPRKNAAAHLGGRGDRRGLDRDDNSSAQQDVSQHLISLRSGKFGFNAREMVPELSGDGTWFAAIRTKQADPWG